MDVTTSPRLEVGRAERGVVARAGDRLRERRARPAGARPTGEERR